VTTPISSASPPPLRTAPAAGGTVSYREAGEGPALVLLHGIGSNSRSWSVQLDALADRWRVIAWDAPGYGESEPLREPHPTGRDYAGRLRDFLDALDIPRCHLVGHSLGALMAIEFCANNSARVRSLVLAHPAMGYQLSATDEWPISVRSRIDDLTTLGPAEFAARRAGRLVSKTASEEVRRFVQGAMSEVRLPGYAQAVAMLAGADIIEHAARVSVPTLVLCGGEDEITPPADGAMLAGKIAGAEYRIIHGAGHASYVEASDAFNQALRDFFERAPRGS
jgi:pimeloyl-ACP methyl ester carboxylesterase